MNRYRLVLFDFDGTLAITDRAIVACMQQTFQVFDIPSPGETEIKATIGFSLGEAFQLLSRAITPEQIPEWIRTYRSFYPQIDAAISVLFPGVKSLLQTSEAEGLKLVVVSNKYHKVLHAALDRFGIRSLVQLAIGADQINPSKPDPALFYKLIQPFFLDISPPEVLVVGDTAVDLQFAGNSGLDCCWTTYGYGNRQQCLALQPNFVIGDILQLSSILQLPQVNSNSEQVPVT